MTTAGAWQPSALEQERMAYRRRQSTRSSIIAVASTAIVVAGLVIGITSTPGWPRVRETFFDPAARAGWPCRRWPSGCG